MAECSGGAKDAPPAVLATTMPQAAAGAGSFAKFVDRTLADVRQVLIAEHMRLLGETGGVPNNQALSAEWSLGRQTSPSEVQPKFTANPTLDAPPKEGQDLDSMAKATADGATDAAASLANKYQTPSSLSLSASSISLGEKPVTGSSTKSAGGSASVAKSSRPSSPLNFLEVLTPEDYTNRKGKTLKHDIDAVNLGNRLMIKMKKEPLEMVDAIMGVIILANAVAIGLSCDTRDWKTGWLLIDIMFALIFIVEFFVKVKILGLRGYLFGQLWYWAWFEVLLIVLSVVEIVAALIMESSNMNGVSLFRVLRLMRLTKLLRIGRVSMATELVMMVNGLIGGTPTLIWAIVLTLFPLSIFALVMRETLGEESGFGFAAESFNTLPKAGFNTFRCLVVEDCSDETGRPIFVLVADEYGWAYSFFYSMTLVFMKFGLYNVIIAIFVEQTSEAAKYNEVHQKRARLNDQMMFHEKSLEMAELAYSLKKGINLEEVACNLTVDEIQSLELSTEEFNDLCKHDDFKDLLAALDVAEEDHLDLFDTLDVDGGGTLDLGEIVSGIGKLRGDARKSDIVAVILLAKHLSRNLTDFKESTNSVLEVQQRQLSSIRRALQTFANPAAEIHYDI